MPLKVKECKLCSESNKDEPMAPMNSDSVSQSLDSRPLMKSVGQAGI